MDVSQIIQACAALLWPVFAFVFLFMFKSELRESFRRFKKIKFGGQEIELAESLDRLQASAVIASNESDPVIPRQNQIIDQEPTTKVDQLIIEAAQSPRVALISLAIELEKTVNRIFACTGWHKSRRTASVVESVRDLQRLGLPAHIADSVSLFWSIRNKIIHSEGVVPDAEILRAIDSGVVILHALKAIPLERNTVYHPGVNIYSDPACTMRWTKGVGIVLETESPTGEKFFRIFPTLKTDYVKGKVVSWDWSFDNKWGKTWYRDPDTEDIKPAWTEAAEFCGQMLDD